MKRSLKFFTGILTLILLGSSSANDSSALTYSQDIGVSFTFNPTISVSLSSSDLIIPNLVAGTSSDSNIITVNVKANTVNGYTLNATVGNNTTFNTRDMVHKVSTVTDKFSSVDFGSSIASLSNLSDNTWAYSFLDESLNNGTNTTWTNYSGLPLYSDETNVATIKATTGPSSSADGDNIKFKIGAKASSSQTSGEYNNVINFTAVAQAVPTTLSMAYENAGKEKLNGYYKLQDMNAEICNNTEVLDEGSQMQAIDTRDNKVYWITKLQDGKCWFTQNLDHDISTSFAYTPANTDIPANWTPDKSTYTTGTTTWDTNYPTGDNIQQSYDPGNKIWDGTPDPNYSTTLDNMAQGTDTHYHIGNYYNFGAAVAMNDTSSYTTNNQDLDQSICPAGWTLPKGGNNTSTGSFRYLISQYGWDSGSDMMENPHMWEAPLYFSPSGDWTGSSSNVVNYGRFWSPVVSGSSYSYDLYGDYGGYVYPGFDSRSFGHSVRCVSR